MPVSGQEIASLDFANLIGGPLNAIVEAQAKSAITTANFIKEVAFDENKQVINVDFKYNRKNDDGDDQDFTLTVPFLTMLPIPYIAVRKASIEFNAKITSINESASDSTFKTEADASGKAGWWFVSSRVTSKTSYQKQRSSSERAERAFDMHVLVEAKNDEMPAGTERILTILENAIAEKEEELTAITIEIVSVDGTNPNLLNVTGDDVQLLNGKTIDLLPKGGTDPAANLIAGATANTITLTDEPEAAKVVGSSHTVKLNP